MLREPFEKKIITAEIKRVGYLKFSRFQNFVILDCSSVKETSQISQMSRVEKKVIVNQLTRRPLALQRQ